MTIVKMATRIPSNGQEHSTEFQLHKSHVPEFDQIRDKIIDFTEHRLARFINEITDVQQRGALLELIGKYRLGQAAIAWRRGRPIFVNVSREK
jgi:hypothetical protein